MPAFPNNTQRHAIFGRTGSGKTVAGLWALQRRNYDKSPWIIIDFKGDATIAQIPGLEEISVKSKPPKKPGLYVVRPLPGVDDDALDIMLWKIWENGKTGVFVDEGYMIPRLNKAYMSLLTQGRSKRIPIITLSQRPAWISPWILSESEFIQVFRLTTKADHERVAQFMPGADVNTLNEYHSWYYNILKSELILLAPVPRENEILDRFDAKRVRRVWI